MAFGSLEPEANGTTHSTRTDTSKPDVDAGTEGKAQNAPESFQNRIVPIVPIPRLVGHHIVQQEKAMKFDIYTPRIEICTPREATVRPRRRRNHTDAGHCLRCIAVAMHCDFFYDGMLILSSNGVFKSQYLFPRISFLYSLPTSLAEPTRFAPH